MLADFDAPQNTTSSVWGMDMKAGKREAEEARKRCSVEDAPSACSASRLSSHPPGHCCIVYASTSPAHFQRTHKIESLQVSMPCLSLILQASLEGEGVAFWGLLD